MKTEYPHSGPYWVQGSGVWGLGPSLFPLQLLLIQGMWMLTNFSVTATCAVAMASPTKTLRCYTNRCSIESGPSVSVVLDTCGRPYNDSYCVLPTSRVQRLLCWGRNLTMKLSSSLLQSVHISLI